MLEKQPNPKKYEEYSSQILNDYRVQKVLKEYFGSIDIKVKCSNKLGLEDWNFKGKKTGCIWNVDGFGYDASGERILIECKHSEKRKIEQNVLAAFAYIIKDIGANSGIIITTLGLQSGAIEVAKAENIGLIQLAYNSTDKNFYVTFSLLDKPTKDKPNRSIMALTDDFNVNFSFTSRSAVTIYPLEEAAQRREHPSFFE